MRAPLSASVTFTKLGCADRALTAALLMRAPLSAAVNNTEAGCAACDPVAALTRAPLAAAVGDALAGLALRKRLAAWFNTAFPLPGKHMLCVMIANLKSK
jgi:hypothetical protein